MIDVASPWALFVMGFLAGVALGFAIWIAVSGAKLFGFADRLRR